VRITLDQILDISYQNLARWGFHDEEIGLINRNLLDAELSGKKTHGFVRLLSIKKQYDKKELNVEPLVLDILSESSTHLHVDGKNKLGFGVIYKALEKAKEKVAKTGLVAVGIKNTGVTGYIGSYAREAVKDDLIYLGFHNSTGGLIPHGSIAEMWGTNPLTVGIPTFDVPIILDMASSQITWGDLLVAKNEDRQLREGVALDKDGKPTIDPEKAMAGGLLPFFGHKGSGLAFIVELLAGALMGSRVGNNVPGGWGSFFILLDLKLFRPLGEFKQDVQTAIEELKNSPKAEGVKEIFFAGEKSYKLHQQHLEQGYFELSDKLYSDLQSLLKGAQ